MHFTFSISNGVSSVPNMPKGYHKDSGFPLCTSIQSLEKPLPRGHIYKSLEISWSHIFFFNSFQISTAYWQLRKVCSTVSSLPQWQQRSKAGMFLFLSSCPVSKQLCAKRHRTILSFWWSLNIPKALPFFCCAYLVWYFPLALGTCLYMYRFRFSHDICWFHHIYACLFFEWPGNTIWNRVCWEYSAPAGLLLTILITVHLTSLTSKLNIPLI